MVRAQEQHFTETIVRREREMHTEFSAKLEEQERVFVVAAAQRDEAKRVRDLWCRVLGRNYHSARVCLSACLLVCVSF